jgi:SpoVK/Ycf46/Vps4 family AAA+-type ATPase
MRPVQWNKEAFERHLVLKPQKKELIKALITVHIASTTSSSTTDIIEGKGKGLIILLHGGPGTGKTLTAESVAELAERPLYRVTCGDIGTDAEGVEKYLESVLYIGTIWGCVVLLDEADVFLEERSQMDLQRNALVSVFLRVLEYYEGILILTSNRVGTFDEAFKSRVQLAMHYPSLDEKGRWEIWRNFMNVLRDDGEHVNYEELKDKLDVLARHKLNGRQIRNTINTARQLARYRKERLAYSHFDQAIDVANEFEEYVVKTHGHDDEEWVRSQRTRY